MIERLSTTPTGLTLVDDDELVERFDEERGASAVDTYDVLIPNGQERGIGEELIYSYHEAGGSLYTLVEVSGAFQNNCPDLFLGRCSGDELLRDYLAVAEQEDKLYEN